MHYLRLHYSIDVDPEEEEQILGREMNKTADSLESEHRNMSRIISSREYLFENQLSFTVQKVAFFENKKAKQVFLG